MVTVLPRNDELVLDDKLPSAYEFWTPDVEEISEEGFGGIHGGMRIVGGQLEAVREQLAAEVDLVHLLAGSAQNPADYDTLAQAIESLEYEDADYSELEELLPMPVVRRVQELDAAYVLDGLDLGVASLVCAMAAAGMFPAASCRGHASAHAWSTHPVVLFATDTHNGHRLEPLVRRAACGFNLDLIRPGLLAVEARSVTEALTLAELICTEWRD